MKRSWGTECAPAWRAWLDRATEQIFRHPDCGAVERELLDHLEDKATDLMRIFPGLTREEAEQRALEEMGAAEELGEELARVHGQGDGKGGEEMQGRKKQKNELGRPLHPAGVRPWAGPAGGGGDPGQHGAE